MQFMLVTHLVLVSVWGSAVQGGWFDLPLHILTVKYDQIGVCIFD